MSAPFQLDIQARSVIDTIDYHRCHQADILFLAAALDPHKCHVALPQGLRFLLAVEEGTELEIFDEAIALITLLARMSSWKGLTL